MIMLDYAVIKDGYIVGKHVTLIGAKMVNVLNHEAYPPPSLMDIYNDRVTGKSHRGHLIHFVLPNSIIYFRYPVFFSFSS